MAKKTTTTKSKQKEIALKQVGRNIMLVIDKKNFSKGIADKEKREKLKALVVKYNTKNTITGEKEIIRIMLEGKTTETTRKKVAVKKAKATVKAKAPIKPKTKKAPAVKTLTKADKLAEAKKMLEEDGFTVSKKAAPTHRGRRKEY